MSPEAAMEIIRNAMEVIAVISLPIAAGALAVGVLISVFQAATQIQDQTLSAVPKIIVVFALIFALGPTALELLRDFAALMFTRIGEGHR